MNNPDVLKSNRRALILIVIGLALCLILLSMPLYSFSASVYTKKSPNTFVGDEKYQQVRAEVEAVAEDYRAKGHEAVIGEDVLERVNSKGKTTSLITFTISESFDRSPLSLIRPGFNASYVLGTMLALFALALVCAVLGSAGTLALEHHFLNKRASLLRGTAAVALLLALLLVPVFILMNNYSFSRQLGLYNAELLTEGKDALFAKMDLLLFDGAMGDQIGTALNGLTMEHSGLLWMLLPCLLVSVLAAVQLRYGSVQSSAAKAMLYFFVVIVCLVTLYPYYVMTVTAFRSNAETLDMYFLHLFPTKWIWSNLSDIIHRGVPRYLLNSLLVAGGATVLAMLCGIPAAYAMARMRFKGKKAFLGFVIMSQMFSPVVLLIGISQLMNTLHLNDSVLGLMLINAAFNQAFAVWLLRGTFVAISPEMEQAALIDGCGTFGALTRVLIPMAAPGIVTALIFVFINAWNEYTIATVLISTAANRPITVGITQFSSFNMIEWQYLFAASLVATIPVVILFMSIEKHLTSGLTSGGVKG